MRVTLGSETPTCSSERRCRLLQDDKCQYTNSEIPRLRRVRDYIHPNKWQNDGELIHSANADVLGLAHCQGKMLGRQ